MTVLEIACSNGRWLRWFKRKYHANVFGIDTSLAGATSVENFVMADGLHLPQREYV
ncbi:MAG: class I SAM-dependent methyltransferase [Candidatus Bathyarchaeia archaeon]